MHLPFHIFPVLSGIVVCVHYSEAFGASSEGHKINVD